MFEKSMPDSDNFFPLSLRLLIDNLAIGTFPDGALSTFGSVVVIAFFALVFATEFVLGFVFCSFRRDSPANGIILTGSVRNFFFLAPD